VWEMQFGSLLWSTRPPGFYRGKGISWDVALDPEGKSLEAFRNYRAPIAGAGQPDVIPEFEKQ
jgi:hypothetical protein